MSFSPQIDKVLTGGLNLLAPSDLLRDDQTLVLQNWRVDEAGQLHSRQGSRRHFTIASLSHIHSMLHTGDTPNFYLGIDDELYRGPNSIVVGFDAEPLGLAGHQGFAWIMNRKLQRKDDGNTPNVWLPDAPVGSPTVYGAAQESKQLVTMDFPPENWGTVGAVGSPVAVFATDIVQEGANSLQLEAEGSGSVRGEWTFPLVKDLGIAGKQNDEDVFTVWLYATAPSAVDTFHFAVDAGDGTFEQDYYFCTIRAADLNPAANSWTEVRIIRRLPDGDVTGRFGFTRVGNTAGKDWSTSRAVRVQADVNEACKVYFDNWKVSGGIAGTLNGDYRWYVTFINEKGHETNPGAASDDGAGNPLTLIQLAAQLVGIPQPTPGQGVTKIRIYRSGGTQVGTFKVDEIKVGETSYLDKKTEEEVTRLGLRLEADHDPPPAARGLAGPYFERLLAYSSEAHPARIWWTPQNQPWYFRQSRDETEGDWVDPGERGEATLYVSIRRRTAWIYKVGSIWRLVGDPDDGDLELTSAGVGAVGPQAVAEAGAVDYFVGRDGVYAFNGDREQRISQAVDPIFRGEWVRLSDGVYVAPMDPQYRHRIVAEFAHGKLYVSYPASGRVGAQYKLENNSETLVYDVESQRWASLTLNSAFESAFTSMHYSKVAGTLFVATLDGNVMAMEQGSGLDDAGGANRTIPLAYQGGYRFQQNPDNEKLYNDVVVEFNTSFIPAGGPGDTLTVKAFYNYGATSETLGTIRAGSPSRSVFEINGEQGRRAHNIAIRIEGNASSECIVSEIALHYYVLPRKGKTYDSGIIDLGTDRVKQVDRLELELEGAGPLDWKLYTDLPTKELVLAAAGTVQMRATQRVHILPISPAKEGLRLRLILGSVVEFQLWRAPRVRALVVGEYIDGAAGDVWETPPLIF